MQGAEDEVEGSVLTYVTETEFRKQRSRSPSCNSLNLHIPLRLPRQSHLLLLTEFMEKKGGGLQPIGEGKGEVGGEGMVGGAGESDAAM